MDHAAMRKQRVWNWRGTVSNRATIGFGTLSLVGPEGWGPPRDPAEAIRVLRVADELGVCVIDTAEAYGPELAEELVAKALWPYDDVFIATKGGVERSTIAEWRLDGHPASLRASCERSLRRLRVETIDLYQLHMPDPTVPLEVSLGCLTEMQTEGKIRWIGVCNVNRAQLAIASSVCELSSVQNGFNLFDQQAEDILRECEGLEIPFLAWFPLGGGRLSTMGGVLERVARRHGVPVSVIALAWILATSKVAVPIPGTSNANHLRDDFEAERVLLSSDEVRALTRFGNHVSRIRR